MSTTMTVKGQVTIPKAVRDRLGLKRGARIDFAENSAGEVVVQLAAGHDEDEAARRVAAFDAALTRTRSRPIRLGTTVDEYMAAIREPVPL